MAAIIHTALLERMSIAELNAAHDACSRAAEAYLAIENQPRCKQAASEFLDEESDRAGFMMQEIVAEMRRRQPVDKNDRTIRARLLAAVAIGAEEWRDALQALSDALVLEAA